jgi:hypothetical protein
VNQRVKNSLLTHQNLAQHGLALPRQEQPRLRLEEAEAAVCLRKSIVHSTRQCEATSRNVLSEIICENTGVLFGCEGI